MLNNIIRCGAFDPRSLGTVALWLEASSQVTLDGSGNVSTWADLSGNGRNATQSSSTLRPAWISNGINGRPAVVGDGVDDLLTISVQLSTGNYSAYVVTAFDTAKPWTQYSGFIGTNSGMRAQECFCGSTAANPDVSVRIQQNGDTTYIAAGNPYNIRSGVSAVHSYRRTGTLAYDQKWSYASRVTSSTATSLTVEFSRVCASYAANSGFRVSEVLIFAKTLSAGEESTLSGYFNSKYGVSI